MRLRDVTDKQVYYPLMAQNRLDHDISIVGVVRDGTVHLRFSDLYPKQDDVVVYIASSPLAWEAVKNSLVPMRPDIGERQ